MTVLINRKKTSYAVQFRKIQFLQKKKKEEKNLEFALIVKWAEKNNKKF